MSAPSATHRSSPTAEAPVLESTGSGDPADERSPGSGLDDNVNSAANTKPVYDGDADKGLSAGDITQDGPITTSPGDEAIQPTNEAVPTAVTRETEAAFRDPLIVAITRSVMVLMTTLSGQVLAHPGPLDSNKCHFSEQEPLIPSRSQHK